MRVRTTLLFALVFTLAPLARGATFYVAPHGDDAAATGTKAVPFASLARAAAAMQPGDTCTLLGGVYRKTMALGGVKGAAGKPLTFKAGEEPAVFRGSEPLNGSWEVHDAAIYKTQTDLDFPQLFMDGHMLVEARWPNMRFPGELWDRDTWAGAEKGSRYGKLVDAALADTNIDWTGARATLNVAHQFFTWTRRVASHEPGSDTFTYAKDLQGITHFADKTTPWEDDCYFLSGKLAALDAPGEWFLDRDTGTLYVWLPGNANPAEHRIEAKVRNHAFELRDCEHVVVEGVDAFAAAFMLENCRHCTVSDVHMLFPTCNRVLDDPNEPEPWVNGAHVTGDHNTVRRCTFAYPSGSGLLMTGAHHTAEDNLIHDAGWYGSLRDRPLCLSAGPKPVEDGFGGVIRHNTVYNVGNTAICFFGQAYLVEYNHTYDGGLACEDVSLVYTHLPTTAGSVVRYNWVHGCRTRTGMGLGIRGDDQTRRLTVHHNVVWDIGRDGIIVKGDYNTVCHNTVFDIDKGNGISLHTQAEPKKPWRKQWPLLEEQNAHSVIKNNAAPGITSHWKGAPFPDAPERVSHNYTGGDMQLVDRAHRDFRPAPGSPLIDAGVLLPDIPQDAAGDAPDIGAYEHGKSAWTPGITWEPGGE